VDESIDGRVDLLAIQFLEATKVSQVTGVGLSFVIPVCLAQLKVPVGFSLGLFGAHSYIRNLAYIIRPTGFWRP